MLDAVRRDALSRKPRMKYRAEQEELFDLPLSAGDGAASVAKTKRNRNPGSCW